MESIQFKELNISRNQESEDFWDYLCTEQFGPEVAYAISKAFWPDFVRHGDFVILSENYIEQDLERIVSQVPHNKVEGTINTVYLQYLFGVRHADPKVWEALGATLCQMWTARAHLLFSDTNFIAEFSWYSDDGDPAVMIEQEKWRNS